MAPAGEVAARDPALRRPRLPVGRRGSCDRDRLVRNPHHWPLPTTALRLRRRRGPMDPSRQRLRLAAGHRPVSAVQPEVAGTASMTLVEVASELFVGYVAYAAHPRSRPPQ